MKIPHAEAKLPARGTDSVDHIGQFSENRVPIFERTAKRQDQEIY